MAATKQDIGGWLHKGKKGRWPWSPRNYGQD